MLWDINNNKTKYITALEATVVRGNREMRIWFCCYRSKTNTIHSYCWEANILLLSTLTFSRQSRNDIIQYREHYLLFSGQIKDQECGYILLQLSVFLRDEVSESVTTTDSGLGSDADISTHLPITQSLFKHCPPVLYFPSEHEKGM